MQRVAELLDEAEWIVMPPVVLGELWAGFRRGQRWKENYARLRGFLANQVYAEIDVALREAGTLLPVNDIWIAACAAAAGVSVLTYDDHFRYIRRIGSIVLS